MVKDPRRVIPLKLPTGRTLIITRDDYERVCAAASRARQSLREWLAANLPKDEEDLRARSEPPQGR